MSSTSMTEMKPVEETKNDQAAETASGSHRVVSYVKPSGDEKEISNQPDKDLVGVDSSPIDKSPVV